MHTINGKEYSEVDINKRCAEILHPNSKIAQSIKGEVMVTVQGGGFVKIMIDYCKNPSDTWPIIDKVWDELNGLVAGRLGYISRWKFIMEQHNCTKLVAACICLIECNWGE